MTNSIKRADWNVNWRLTESSGLMVYLADYRGRRVLWEGSLPYVTVDHQTSDVAGEGSGQEGAEHDEAPAGHGPFWVPLGERTLAGEIRTNELRSGFELSADFVAGPYRYTQMWRFHQSGRLEPWLTIHGAGVHDGHTYHPHWRFDFDVGGARHDTLELYDGESKKWTRVTNEGWFPKADGDERGNVWRQVDSRTKAAVTIRPHQCEDAELFAIRYHEGEWAPFSPRSAADAQSFPAAYVGDEPLAGHDVMLWYVSHIHFDAGFPFTAGPWISISGM